MNQAEGDVDLKVFSKFFDDGVAGRVFVDVGAARPDYLSISALYRKKGWRVIAIEPNPDFADMHRKLGHEVFEYACGTEDRDGVEFNIANSHATPYKGGNVSFESFSSLSLKPGYKKLLPPNVDLRQIVVRVRRLDTILTEAKVQQVDILSIDVEGWELEVLNGLDVKRYSPQVMIVENFLDEASYQTRIEDLGYRLWKAIAPNQIFARADVFEKLPALERIAARLR